MPVYPSPQAKYNISDPASYPGTGSTLFDVSANSFDITLNNVTYNDAYGNVPSLVFDGTSTSFGYFNGAIANIVSATAVFSFNIWVKAPIIDPPYLEALFGYGKDGSPGIGGIPSIWTDRTGNNVTFDFGSSNPAITSGFIPPPNAWECYSITNDGTDVSIYVNGTLRGTASSVGKQINTPPRFCIGGFDTDLTNVSYPCYFELGYLEIHNTALSSLQVLDFYNTTKAAYSRLVEYDFGNGSYSGSGSTILDLSGCGNILTFPSGLTYTTIVGGEISLTSAQTGQITSSYPNNLPVGPQAHTMVIWGRYNDAYNCGMFAHGGANNGTRIDAGYGEGARLGVEVNGVGSRTSLADTPAIGDWFQFVIVKPTDNPAETNGDLVFYYNGSLSGTEIFNGLANINITNNGVPGSGPGLAINWNYYPIARDISIIKTAIYNGAWDGTDVTADYGEFLERTTPVEPFLQYDFSDPACYSGSGPTVFDLTANNNDGTITGPTFVSDGSKSYFNFNSGTDLITSSSVPTTTLSDFTINVWCYPENSSTENVVLSIGNDGAGTIPFIDYSLFTPGRFLISNGSNVGTVEASIATPINEWYMVTYTKIGTAVKIYINGVAAGTATGTISIADPAPLRLGGYSPGIAPNFDGRIAIFEIYAEGLSNYQVNQLYNLDESRFVPVPPPPVSNGVGGRQFAQGFNG